MSKYIQQSMRCILLGGSMVTCSAVAAAAAPLDESTGQPALEEIVVTARSKSESLQSVPDSISAFTSVQIERANIQSVADVARLSPGLNFRDGSSYRVGNYDLRIRGIGQGQQGWPAASVLIDGVPADSPEAVQNLSFSTIEQVEVLRGPQSALYGAGAIAGALNITTRRPTNELQSDARVYYGNGNNFRAGTSVSGAIVPDKVLARFTANYIDDDGRFESKTNGVDLGFTNQRDFAGRVLINLADNLEVDVNGSYLSGRNGLSYQERLPSAAYLNTFDGFYNSRAKAGEDQREIGRFTTRVNWEPGDLKVSAVGAYTSTKYDDYGDSCFDDVNDPQFGLPTGGVACLTGTVVYGDDALPGQNRTLNANLYDKYETYFGELRIGSNDNGPVQWIAGASSMRRDYLSGLALETEVVGQAINTTVYGRADAKVDEWWGVFGQLQVEFGRFELTMNGRYDHQEYRNTAYRDPTKAVLVPVTDAQGNLISTQVNEAEKFQPKVQLSYDVTDEVMVYGTVSRGFRPGYYNSGGYAAPETTTNYEAGFKSRLLDRRVTLNAAAFHIDYSNQQVSTTIAAPPFRATSTVPKTKIDGVEAELNVQLTSALSIGSSATYLHAELTNGTDSPKSPEWSGSLSVDFEQPVSSTAWTFRAHADDSFHTSQYLALGNTQQVESNHFLNARVGVENDTLGFWLVGTNLSDTQESQIASGINPYYFVRYPTQPRSYGVEVRAQF